MIIKRTTQGQEIDYLEEANGVINGFEIKLRADKFKKLKSFLENYEKSSIKLINKKNFREFI